MNQAPSAEVMAEIERLRHGGLFLQAWAKLQTLTDPATWQSVEWRVSAATLRERLGGRSEAEKVVLRLWKRHRSAPEAPWEEMLWTVHRNRGAVEAWHWLRRWHPPEPANVRDRQDHLAARAYISGAVRDFTTARALAEEARALDDSHHWPHCVLGLVSAWEDRHAEALQWAGQALARQPGSVAGHHLAVDSLIALGRDEEALRLLQAAAFRLEAGSLAWSLTVLQMELGDFAAAAPGLARTVELHPLADPPIKSALAALHCDLACHLEAWDEAARWAEKVEGSDFYTRVKEQLGQRREGFRRRLLPVGFTRQAHLTCVPATLTTLAKYWGRAPEHLDLVEAMCHDGTPYHSERKWAVENGWISREFTVTAEVAKALVDRGVPFTISTVHVGGGHCQAVVGYDEFRRVLLIRDPHRRSKGEFLMDEMLEQQKANGPRGHIILPSSEAGRLDGVALPDADLWDLHHEAALALDGHDRPVAEHALARLQWGAPDHRLTLQCQGMLAAYDARPTTALEAVNSLLAQFPSDVNLKTRQLSLLQQLEKVPERLERLREACEGPHGHPYLWREYASALSGDSRRQAEVRRWLRRSDRAEVSAFSVWMRAHLLWQQGRREEATDLHRLAACLDDKNESFAAAYFHAARWTRRSDEALTHLRRRVAQDGTRSSAPAQTLFAALETLNRQDEALDALRSALARRPTDDDFKLWAAERFALWGAESEAVTLLGSISRGRHASRCKVEAWLAARRGDRPEVERLWREVLAEFPLSVEATQMVADSVAEREGPVAALTFVRERAALHPHFLPLRHAVIERSRPVGPPEWEASVREFLQVDPASAWGLRELALTVIPQHRQQEAMQALEEAEALEPGSEALHGVRGEVLESLARPEEAVACYRRALSVSVDHEPALRRLVALSATVEQRRDALSFIQAELIRQTTNGNGVLTFAEEARPYLGADEMGDLLRRGHAERPDLWQSGIVLARHLSHCGHLDDAAALVREQTTRFPLLPRVWVECALVHREALRRDEETAALEQARTLNPAWGWAMRELAQSYRLAGRFDKSLEVMEQAVRHSPADALNHGWLADERHHAGDVAGAVEALKQAVRRDASYRWAWSALAEWSTKLGAPDAAEKEARQLVAERPGDVNAWMALSHVLDGPVKFAEKLAALDRAMSLAPRAVSARDDKARVLTLAGRFAEALDVCRQWPGGTAAPVALEARAAWILSRRGDVRAAITAMRQVVARDPGHLWAWENLATWHQQVSEFDEAEAAIATLAKQQPHHAVPHGYLGEFLLARGKKDAAKHAFARSVDIDPGYQYGAFELFELHERDQEYAKADEVLRRVAPHVHPADVGVRRVALALSRRDERAFATEIDAFLSHPDDRPAAYHYLVEWLRHRSFNLAQKVEKAARAKVFSGQPCNVHTGALATDMRLVRGEGPDRGLMRRLGTGNAAAARVHVRALNELARRVQTPDWLPRAVYRRAIRRHVAKHRQWFTTDTELWGTAGYALFCAKKYRATAALLADWRQRPNTQPWMFNNLVVALHLLGRLDEAGAIRRHVSSLPLHNDVTQRFSLWQALDDARSGHSTKASALLAGTNARLDDAYDTTVRKMTELFIELRTATQPPAFDDAAEAMLQSFMTTHRGDKALMPAVKEVAALWDRKAGGVRVRWWLFMRRYYNWLVVAGVLLLVIRAGQSLPR